MTSPVDVTNMALANIGARTQVTSINPSDGSQAGDVASLLYQPKMDALFRAAHWNCARRQGALTVLRAYAGMPENPSGALPNPPAPWLYMYALASDCLKVRYLIPAPVTSSVGGSPPVMTNIGSVPAYNIPRAAIPYVVGIELDDGGNQIKVLLTNLQNAIAVYTGRILNCDLWDPSFMNAATATLGAFFVNPLSRSAELATQQATLAQAAILQARISDGNEGPTSTDHTPDFMLVRGVGVLGPSDPYWLTPWDSMAFPGGLIV